METTSTSGIQYIITKRPYENEQYFYEKGWDITKQNPQTQDQFLEAYKISQLRQNEKDLKCVYSKSVKKHIITT
jgi:hypothetical protein